MVQRIALQHRVGARAAVADVVLDADRPRRLVTKRVPPVAVFLPERTDMVDRSGGVLGGGEARRDLQNVIAHADGAGFRRPGRRGRKGDGRAEGQDGQDERDAGSGDAEHADSLGLGAERYG